jgi:hypothetical protein
MNGIRVSGAPVYEFAVLNDGDEIQIGRSTFTFEVNFP